MRTVRIILGILSIELGVLAQDPHIRIGPSYVSREEVADLSRLSDDEVSSAVGALATTANRKIAQLRLYSKGSPRLDGPIMSHLPLGALVRLDSSIEMEEWCLVDALFVDGDINVRRRCGGTEYREAITGRDPLSVNYLGITGKVEYVRFDFVPSSKVHRVEVFVVGPVIPTKKDSVLIFRRFQNIYTDISVSLWWSSRIWFPESGRFALGFPFVKNGTPRPSTTNSAQQPYMHCFEVSRGEGDCQIYSTSSSETARQ